MNPDRARLAKLLGMLGSNHDGEILNDEPQTPRHLDHHRPHLHTPAARQTRQELTHAWSPSRATPPAPAAENAWAAFLGAPVGHAARQGAKLRIPRRDSENAWEKFRMGAGRIATPQSERRSQASA